MSETLPNQQESQNWHEKLELHKNAAQLNASEIKSVLGSSLVQNRADFGEMFEADTITDSQYEDNIHKIDGALGELAGLQVLGEGSQADCNQDLQLLALSLKQEQEKLPFGNAEFLELADRRASVKYLIDQFDVEIKMPQEELEKDTKPSERREAIKNWTNQTIEAHNNRVDGDKTESIADSPEIREAQERINARFAEQAKQPQPTETVDDARQKVAEAFGDRGEKERQALIGEVVRAAKGSARIHTSVTKETKLRFRGREDIAYNDGFSDFGEGLDWGTHNWRENGTFLNDTSEAFIFELATTTRKKTVTETIETGGRFRKKTEQVQKEVADGEVPTMIVNPATGQQEPGVNVRYQFDGNTSNKAWGSRSLEKNDLPKYEAPDNNRGGNQLFIEVVLPKSVADTLQQAALRSPDVARQFAQSMVTENGATEATVKMPPYTELPTDWTMTVATLQKDTFSDRGRTHTLRNIANRQDVKV
jgi:hypothetical protein